MKKQNIILGLILIGLSVILHGIHYVVFHDLHHIMIFLFADIAFIPLEVLFVSLILERLIKKTEEEKILKKMHMLVGLFYQKFGDDLLKSFVAASDFQCTKVYQMDYKWTKRDYMKLKQEIKLHPHEIHIDQVNIKALFDLMHQNEPLMINLISNPSLQENEIFSDLLLATFHLYDELRSRDLERLTQEDQVHLAFDVKRSFKLLSAQWVDYMEHLQVAYPYLFLTAALNNPYDDRKQEVINEVLLASR